MRYLDDTSAPLSYPATPIEPFAGGVVLVARCRGLWGAEIGDTGLRWTERQRTNKYVVLVRSCSHAPNAPPRTAVASKMVALKPASSQVFAVTRPAGPAPMTATFRTACGRELCSTGSGSNSYSWLVECVIGVGRDEGCDPAEGWYDEMRGEG